MEQRLCGTQGYRINPERQGKTESAWPKSHHKKLELHFVEKLRAYLKDTSLQTHKTKMWWQTRIQLEGTELMVMGREASPINIKWINLGWRRIFSSKNIPNVYVVQWIIKEPTTFPRIRSEQLKSKVETMLHYKQQQNRTCPQACLQKLNEYNNKVAVGDS